MKGWEFTGTHQPLKIVEKPDPKAKPGYVVLKTLAGGLCHSDVSALDIESWMPQFNVPVIMGHEVCGKIVEIGEGVEGFEIGDVVAVCPLYAKDGTTPGYTRDGGYGTMTTAPVEQLVKVPEGVSPAKAAAATDAGATSYHALCSVGGAKEGTKVGIIGVGGLGQFAVSIAVAKEWRRTCGERFFCVVTCDRHFFTTLSTCQRVMRSPFSEVRRASVGPPTVWFRRAI
jgi:propanol-preferring alcohol dehydrogenase